MRLKTVLHLASLFPILLSALFILHLFTIHISVFSMGDTRGSIPMTGAILMSIFSLMVGWGFYRVGHKLVKQVNTLEQMAEQVKQGDLNTTAQLPDGKGEVAEVVEVFSQLVVELRGYVELIGAHKQLKQEYEDALAKAELLRQSAVQSSGALELLRRAERGVISWMTEQDIFLFTWLPHDTLRETLGVLENASGNDPAGTPSELQKALLALVKTSEKSALAKDGDSRYLSPENISTCEAFDDAVRLCRGKWRREGFQAKIDIKVNKADAGPFDIHADRLSLVQAFAAILMNAAEAMPDGGVITVEFQTDISGTVNISITDQGAGMSNSVRARCMKPFFSTKEGRLGIGLTLAKRFAARYGARFGVIGEPGMGTSVHMSFPRRLRQAGEEGVAKKQIGQLSILLVEDDDAVRETLLAMLSRENHLVTAVEDGAVAVLRLREKPFDIVITDRAMPIMSGEELAAAVKSRYPSTPVLLVTAAGEEMERQQLQPEGVDVILSKPVLREDLKIAIVMALEKAESENPRKES
ncbi:MAG: response regulator [Kiritimatiellia bacterium]|jgi:signal transduction histidine kinase/CheY-like chemotaxis protein|nr:response regulator [Kiritimatiellia bacterium]